MEKAYLVDDGVFAAPNLFVDVEVVHLYSEFN